MGWQDNPVVTPGGTTVASSPPTPAWASNPIVSGDGFTPDQQKTIGDYPDAKATMVNGRYVLDPGDYKPAGAAVAANPVSASDAMDRDTRFNGGIIANAALSAREGLNNVGTGVLEGIAGLPDLAIRGVSKLGSLGAHAAGLDTLGDALDKPITLGGLARNITGVPESPDGAAGVVRAVSRGLGGVVGGTGIGGMLSEAASPAASWLGNLLQAAPRSQAAGAVAGSIGSEAVRQGGGTPLEQTLTGVGLGGVGGLAAEGATAVGGAVRNALTGPGAAIRAGAALADQTADVPAALSAIDNAAPQVSGAQPTLAEVTRDPGIAGYQRSIGSGTSKAGAAIDTRMQQNAAARVAAVDATAGPGDVNALPEAAEAQSSALSTTARTTADATGPAAYPETSGAAARATIGANHAAAQDATRAAYGAPELAAKTPVNVPHSFYDTMRDKLATFYGDAGGHVPAPLASILDDLAGADDVNSNTLANVDRRLADYAGGQRVAGANREAAFAESVRHDLGTVTDDALSPEQSAALAKAKAARRDQADTFETGSVGKVTDKGDFGRPSIADSAVPQVLIPKGRAGGEAVAKLIKSVGPEQAEAVAREELRRQMDAASTAAQIGRIRADFAPALRQFPDLQSEVETAHGQMSLSEAFTGTPLGKFADPNKAPQQVVGSMLDAKDGGQAFGRLANSVASLPSASAGLRRSIAGYVTDAAKVAKVTATGEQAVSTGGSLGALRNVIDKAAGTTVFDPTQLQALRSIKTEMEGAQFADTANRAAGSDTTRNGAAKVASQLAGHSRSMRIARAVWSVLNNQGQTDAFIQKAILDPKFAAELIRNVPKAQATAAAQRLVGGLTGASTGVAANAGP